MHKKHNKLNHKDHHHSSSRKIHRYKKDSTDTRLEVPQNSRSDVNKKVAVENGTTKENKYKHKHKHKTSEEVRSNDHRNKNKHEDKLVYNISDIQGLVLDKEGRNHKEKKEKRDKERLNKIEKYLEGLDKACTRKASRNRSHSLGSSETVFKNQDVSFRREKTFHEKLKRHASTNSQLNISNEKYSDHAQRRKSSKKHKHNQNKERESSKEKNTKDTSVSYCQVETENPFLHKKKKYDVERLYPEESYTMNERSSRRRSSSKDSYSSPQAKMETSPKHHREKNRDPREKKTTPIKFSPKRSKSRTDFKKHKEQKSNTSLGPYRKYFAFDKKSQEKETTHHKKKRQRKVDSVEKIINHAEKKEKIEAKPEKSKKNQERTSSAQSDQYKEKIEDDIKSYFTRIQSLIDKKLDYILGNSNSKETKSSLAENEPVVEKTRRRKPKKEDLEAEKLLDRNFSKKKKNEKRESTPVEKKEKHSEEVARPRHSEEKKVDIESKRVKNTHNTSSTSLRRERYPSADSTTRRRRPSPSARWPYENCQPSATTNETRQDKRTKSPCREPRESRMRPDQLINMLEHPSSFSLHSKASATKQPVVEESRHRSYQHQRGDSVIEPSRRRGRSTARSDAISNEDNIKFKEFQKAYQEAYTKKMKKHMVENPFTCTVQSNTYLTKEQLMNESKYATDTNHMGPDGNGHHQKRDRSLTKKYTAPDEDEYKMKELESAYIQEIHNKKMKKRIRQMMNLECKTVSIVGIPSQLRESTIFNETQTTTSLNVINQVEDFIEKKKKSKRFKLYYKYSVADNKCPNESDKSSEGKKSIISDSYRVVSDPSDHNIDIWEDVQEEVVDVGKDSTDMANILFVMKNKTLQKQGIEISGKNNSIERSLKKYRKRSDSPKTSMLNNILEEPSNISILVHHNEAATLLSEDLDCTFFNTLKSSSSDCDLELNKRHDRSSLAQKQKTHRVDKHTKEPTAKSRSPTRREHEKEQRDVRLAKKPKYEEKYEHPRKVRKMESQQRIKKKQHINNTYKFTSKSDINISYDSLTKHKPKQKPKFEPPSNLREQLKHLLPEFPARKRSPERKSIDLILKEELRQILKEIPRSMACKETSFDDLSQIEVPTSANKCIEEETKYPKSSNDKEPHENREIEQQPKDLKVSDDKDPNDNQTIPQMEEKKFCSKKIGTHQGMTKIPSLIRGYINKTVSQVNNRDIIENHASVEEINQNIDQQEHIEEQQRRLVDTGVEVDVTKENLTVEEPTYNILDNKMSQTPTPKVDMGIEVEMDPTRSKTSRKVSGSSKIKRCEILDPFTSTKLGYTIKSTRPIINLENNHFPNRKSQESSDTSRPASSQYKRQKSNLSEGRSVKFERRDGFQEENVKPSKQRPTSVGKETNKSHRIPTKSALTMSTKVITINSPIYREKCFDAYDAQTKSSKKSVTVNPSINKQYMREKRASTAGYEKRRQEELSSKSALSLNDADSRIGSLVCVDRFSDYHKLNLNSNSNCRSLDQYTMKSIINYNPQSSRLFLTKNFNTQMNTYQRRKMYDECMRKKMKKKYGNQNQMGPRIFEVRYLTLGNENLNDHPESNQTTGGHRTVNKFPTFNTKLNKPRQRSKACKPLAKKSRKNFPISKEDACKFSGRDIFAPIISDVDQLNKFRRKSFPEKNVEEIFVKKGTPNKEQAQKDDVQSSSAETDEKCVSSEQLKPPNINKENVDPNFKELIDCLYNSIITYCNSKFKLTQQETPDSEDKQQIVETRKVVQGSTKPPLPINEVSYVVFPKSPQEKRNPQQAITTDKKNSSSEGNVSSEDKQSGPHTNLVCDHLSCPVLTGSTSSFDYLYEDGSIELNKEAVLLHFRKPVKTILGYALNNTHNFPKKALLGFHRKDDQISNSATESEESGYSSNNSKKCASVCSFFKKPSIINLFKPVRRLEGGLQSTTSSVADSRSDANLQEYDVMNQRCKEYAEKVRVQSQSRHEPLESFQEIPLDVLLFCKKSCTGLDDFNSNCSLCKKHSTCDLPDITEIDELSNTLESLDCHLEEKLSLNSINLYQEENTAPVLSKSKIQAEQLLLYNGLDHKRSLDIISYQKSETNCSKDFELIKEMIHCPVVLSITNLNTCSLTVIEESPSNESADNQEIEADAIEENSVLAADVKESYSRVDLKSSPVDLDGRSDISSNSGFRNTYSPSAASKYMAKRFFDNLLKVYEKEMLVTNKLFQDEQFFSNILLESIKSGEPTKTKNTKLKKFIRGKIKTCLGNVWFSKTGLDRENNGTGGQNIPSTNSQQRKLQILASDARQYFSMFVQAVKTNKDINDEVKICGLLKLLERIEDGDFAVLRRKEDVDFEEEIREQVKEAFVNIYQISIKEAKKRKRSLTTNDLKLIRTFVSKYRIGLLSKTDLIASYIGRGVFKTEGHLKAAVTYLIQHNKNNEIDLKDFDQHCKILEMCSV